jgi:hypothetical protein
MERLDLDGGVFLTPQGVFFARILESKKFFGSS